MSNEKPDEFLSWRGPLSRPDVLPEHGLEDREMSWEKLAERLRDKPRRRWTGYWIAAACLLLLLAPIAHLFLDRPDRVALYRSVRRQSASVQSRPPVTTPRGASNRASSGAPRRISEPGRLSTPVSPLATIARPALRAQAAPSSNAHSNYGEFAPIKNSLAIDTLPAPASVAEALTPAISVNMTPDAPLAAITPRPNAAPFRRPLRIVYLNELNKDKTPAPAMVRRNARFLQFGDGATRVSDPVSPEDNPSLLTIKFSSQNP